MAPGVYVVPGDTGRGSEGRPNAGFIVTGDGVVVIDALASPAQGERLVRAVRSVTREPISWLVLTHHHPDHHFGAVALRRGGARVMAHPDVSTGVDEQSREAAESAWTLVVGTQQMAGFAYADMPDRAVLTADTLRLGGETIVHQEHAIYTSASNVTICNNVFYNQVHGWDIQTAGGKNLFITNNTFAFPNPNRDGHIILWDQGITNSLSNIVIQNNIFYQPGSHAVVTELDGGGSISGCTNENNLTTAGSIYDNGSSCTLANNMTSIDPSFVNPLGHDFHLQSGSRAIDNGMTSSITQIDFDDWLRPVNSIYDRGAFEYHSASALSLTLSASPTSLSVTQGGSVKSTIIALAVGASPVFSASGLPSGVTATFSPSTCSGSCTTTLTLTASSTAQGSSTVTVKANSGAISASTAIALNVLTTSPTTGDYTSGLAAEWRFNGTAADSVNHNNGNLSGGATWSISTYNGTPVTDLSLNGSSAFVSVGESASLEMSQNMTVSFWLNTGPVPSTSVSKGDTDPRVIAKVYDWDIKLNGAVHPQFSAGGKYAMASYSVPLGVWTHVVFTYASGVVNAYVNGQPASLAANTFTGTGTLPTGKYGLYIGTDSGITEFYSGKIADVRVYNRALKANDVLALHSGVTP